MRGVIGRFPQVDSDVQTGLVAKIGTNNDFLGRQECVTGYVPAHYVLMLVPPYQMVMCQSNPWDAPYENLDLRFFPYAPRSSEQ
jgi:hypothetical protein